MSEAEAKRIAAKDGLDWAKLPEAQPVARRRAAMMATRQPKQSGEPAEEAWRERAEGLGYRHESVLGHHKLAELDVQDRRDRAYAVAAPILAAEFAKDATIPTGKVREIAARGLIEAGIGDRPEDDIAAVLVDFQRGIEMPDGQVTRVIIAGQAATTRATVEQEREAITLARKAYDAGKLSAEIGAAGSGKSYRTGKLADRWRDQGHTVWGAALAWRQTGRLPGGQHTHRSPGGPDALPAPRTAGDLQHRPPRRRRGR